MVVTEPDTSGEVYEKAFKALMSGHTLKFAADQKTISMQISDNILDKENDRRIVWGRKQDVNKVVYIAVFTAISDQKKPATFSEFQVQ